MIPKHKHTNFSEIDEYIFIGTNFCCQVHFDETLLDKGITADLSLEEIRIDSPFVCFMILPL